MQMQRGSWHAQEDWYCDRENLRLLGLPASIGCFNARILLLIIADIMDNCAIDIRFRSSTLSLGLMSVGRRLHARLKPRCSDGTSSWRNDY